MRSNDIAQNNLNKIRQQLIDALKANDAEAFSEAFEQILANRAEAVRQEYEDTATEKDLSVLSARGIRQLTSEEKNYYQKFSECLNSPTPKQALANLEEVMPKTIINSVLTDLEIQHPLLSAINFIPGHGLIEFVVNTNGMQRAVFGPLTAKITEELTSGFKVVDTALLKLTAFIPIAKAMLDLGPEWLDNYIRRVLYEALANGLEYGIVNGTGKNQPIGMNRQVGDGVTVTNGEYPKKAAIKVTEFTPKSLGNILSICAVDAKGNPRTVSGVILLVNPQDYLQNVMPATTIMAPDGTYRNDVLPYPMTIIQTIALERGEAIIGISKEYFAGVGTSKDGKIEYDDSYRFLEDERVYLIKAYMNGFPMDNNAFQRLDISELEPKMYKVVSIDPLKPSKNADLIALSLGAATLSPVFDSNTVNYTATTNNTHNTVNAVPADSGAKIEVRLGNKIIENGAAITWETGENVLTIKAIAADETTSKTYIVTVTKE